MDIKLIAAIAIGLIVACVVIILVLRRKTRISGQIDIPGIGTLRGSARDDPRNASITDGTATGEVLANAPQGSATLNRVQGTSLTAIAGENTLPKG